MIIGLISLCCISGILELQLQGLWYIVHRFPPVVWVITTFNWPGLESCIEWDIYYPYPQHLAWCQACSWCLIICVEDAGEYREKEISGSSPSYIPRVGMWCSSHVLCTIPRRYHGLPCLWVSPPSAWLTKPGCLSPYISLELCKLCWKHPEVGIESPLWRLCLGMCITLRHQHKYLCPWRWTLIRGEWILCTFGNYFDNTSHTLYSKSTTGYGYVCEGQTTGCQSVCVCVYV